MHHRPREAHRAGPLEETRRPHAVGPVAPHAVAEAARSPAAPADEQGVGDGPCTRGGDRSVDRQVVEAVGPVASPRQRHRPPVGGEAAHTQVGADAGGARAGTQAARAPHRRKAVCPAAPAQGAVDRRGPTNADAQVVRRIRQSR